MAFREDDSQTVSGHAAANLAMLRRAALSLLKQTGTQGIPHSDETTFRQMNTVRKSRR